MTHADDTEREPDAADEPTTEVPATDAGQASDTAPDPSTTGDDEQHAAAEHDTVPQPAVAAEPTSESHGRARSRLDGRSVAIGAVGAALVVLAFGAGMAVRDHGDGDRHGNGRLEMMGGRGPQGGPGGMQGGGGPGMRGGDSRGGGMPGPGGQGGGMMGGERGGGEMMGGPGGRHHDGTFGEVTKVSSSSITIDPVRGGDPVTVKLTSDTKVLEHGDDGPGDVETRSIDDIETGDTVMVHVANGDSGSKATADAVIVLPDRADHDDD